jgi:glycosyltransferase involved in cell wall biosynthesis
MLDPWSLSQKRVKKMIWLRLRLCKQLRRAAAIHFTTLREAELAAGFYQESQKLVEPNGIFPNEYHTSPTRTIWDEFEIPRGARIALFLGRLHPKKGISFVINAVKHLNRPDLTFVIAGPDEGGYRSELEALAGSFASSRRVVFTGMLTGDVKKAALASADFSVLMSHQENFGNTIVESIASGTPVLISPHVNLADMVKQCLVGEVVPLDSQLIASVVARWLDHPEVLEGYAARARSVAVTEFDWHAISRRWIEHYRRLAT